MKKVILISIALIGCLSVNAQTRVVIRRPVTRAAVIPVRRIVVRPAAVVRPVVVKRVVIGRPVVAPRKRVIVY